MGSGNTGKKREERDLPGALRKKALCLRRSGMDCLPVLALQELPSPPRGQVTAVLSSGLASLKHREQVAARGHPDTILESRGGPRGILSSQQAQQDDGG